MIKETTDNFESFVKGSMDVLGQMTDINCKTGEIYLKEDRLKKQLNYAHQRGIPLVIIVGPEESERSMIGLRDMRKKIQLA